MAYSQRRYVLAPHRGLGGRGLLSGRWGLEGLGKGVSKTIQPEGRVKGVLLANEGVKFAKLINQGGVKECNDDQLNTHTFAPATRSRVVIPNSDSFRGTEKKSTPQENQPTPELCMP